MSLTAKEEINRVARRILIGQLHVQENSIFPQYGLSTSVGCRPMESIGQKKRWTEDNKDASLYFS